ncbi:Uncharacterised protein [Amycolatopsis camponoti]|uniref:Uncharacterized protein n=1 Tax=Amycolatopsis camponoti TaxID=2606593 RepID=A0A6I8LRG0_9PSEU|nr:hypothetical protein [Amycolatopsis camponoti]VVJ17669.1 Uncharacterised protein [Amycolatopsis camponoti]
MRGWTLPEPRWEWEWTHPSGPEPPSVEREGPAGRAPGRIATVGTWAGSFTVGRYALQEVFPDVGDLVVGYGAAIGMSFRPNAFVDADRIEFVQLARSVKNGAPYNKYTATDQERKTAESRMVPGDGAHIDQLPRSPVPWYAPATPGRRRKDAKEKPTDASMTDGPNLSSGDDGTSAAVAHTGAWSQQFETAAVATAGPQKGTYYGSVRWGWSWPERRAPELLKFEVVSAGVPSPAFLAAARLWNDSKTTGDARPEAVPIAERRTVTAKTAQLWDNLVTRVTIAALPKGTPLQRIDLRPSSLVPSRSWFWTKVAVTGGRHAGRTGWLWLTDLSR